MHFVFDLDGTICFTGNPISDKILDALAQLTRDGHEVIFASARPIRDMLPVLRSDFHDYPMIGGNGSLISRQGKMIKSFSFSSEEMEEILKLITQFDATYLIDSDWDYAYTGPDDHPILRYLDPHKLANLVTLDSLPSIVKVLILTSKNNELLAERLSSLNVYINRHRSEDVLDISPNGIHKWSALRILGIEKRQYIAFGNDANDITMFENALHSVMIGYHEQLASIAKDSILVDEYTEDNIVAKLKEISNKLKQ